MANRIFDKETLLDLTVNVIPLFIILFFVVVFALINPWGFDPLGTGLQYALLVGPFVALAVLTYLSGKAIAGAEKNGKVFLPGQANVTGAKTLHEREQEERAAELAAREGSLEAADDAGESASADDAEADATADAADGDVADDAGVEAADEPDAEVDDDTAEAADADRTD